jgi:antirestriction protein ArdC
LSCWAGVAQSTKENSRAYIQGWLNILKNDKNMLLQASHKGREASDYILGNIKAELFKNLQ